MKVTVRLRGKCRANRDDTWFRRSDGTRRLDADGLTGAKKRSYRKDAGLHAVRSGGGGELYNQGYSRHWSKGDSL